MALLITEVMLVSALNALERRRRYRILGKWLRGELTMTQLLWLKRQLWFRKAFPERVCESAEKKTQ